MPAQGFQIPATLFFLIVVWIGGSYIAGPTIGNRLITNGGEISRCERKLAQTSERALRLATLQIGPPPSAPKRPNANAATSLIGGFLRGHEGGGAFLRRYSGTIRGMYQPYIDAAFGKQMSQYRTARSVWEGKVNRIQQAIKLRPGQGASICSCRARIAVNEAHSDLAWHVGTLSLVKNGALNDWQAAMKAPTVRALCPVRG